MRLPKFLRPQARQRPENGGKGALPGGNDTTSGNGFGIASGAGGGRTPSDAEFRAIYEAHFESVWHALRRLSVAERDLLDATQNVFLVVHRKLPEFEGRSQLRTWIFQICRRVASDYRRSASVRREVATDSQELADQADKRAHAIGSSDRSHLVQVARSILDRLPDAQREVFLLYELEQFSGEEIAEQLGIPVGTVRSRLRLAREAFRREVESIVDVEEKKPALVELASADDDVATDPFAIRRELFDAAAPPGDSENPESSSDPPPSLRKGAVR